MRLRSRTISGRPLQPMQAYRLRVAWRESYLVACRDAWCESCLDAWGDAWFVARGDACREAHTEAHFVARHEAHTPVPMCCALCAGLDDSLSRSLHHSLKRTQVLL